MSRVRSNRVCFTWNNYDEDELDDLEAKLKSLEQLGQLQYSILGREIGESGTPHIQGYVHLRKEYHPSQTCGLQFWKNLLPGGKRMHFENARGKDSHQYIYCTKEGPFIEFGTIKDTEKGQDFAGAIEAAKQDMDICEKEYPELYLKYHFQLEKIHQKAQNQKPESNITELRSWQHQVIDLLKKQNDRQILFVVDEEGGKGKSTLCKHLLQNENTWACQGGKVADLMHAYNTKAEYAIFDMARCNNPDYYPWNFMENLKSGWYTSTKYNGGMKCFKPPKIAVFLNEEPPRNKLSNDRYQIFRI